MRNSSLIIINQICFHLKRKDQRNGFIFYNKNYLLEPTLKNMFDWTSAFRKIKEVGNHIFNIKGNMLSIKKCDLHS